MNLNFTHSGEGEIIDMPGIKMMVRVDAQASGGKLSVIEKNIEPGYTSPLQVCSEEDKVIYIIDGSFSIYINGPKIEPDKNGAIFIRKGLPHNYKNTGTDIGKLMVILTPGGHENFLRDLSLTIKQYGHDKGRMFETAMRNKVILL